MVGLYIVTLVGCLPWGSVTVTSDQSSGDTGTEPVVAVSELVAGDLVVTEIMTLPLGEFPPYVEFTSTVKGRIQLRGLEIRGGAGRYVVDRDLVLAPREWVVAGPKGLGPGNLFWSGLGPELDRSRGDVSLWNDDTLIDEVQWDQGNEWPSGDGQSLSLSADATDHLSNDDVASWCLGTSPIAKATLNQGTPQSANPACPVGTR